MHDSHPRDAPDIRDVAVTCEYHVHLKLPQHGHHIPRIAQYVHVAARARNGQDVAVDDEYLRPPRPIAELRVEPGVVLAADLALGDRAWLNLTPRP